MAKFVVSGTVTLGYELVLGHFLEFLKGASSCDLSQRTTLLTTFFFFFCFAVAKQTQPGTYYQIASQIVGQKGIAGVLDGFFPWGAAQALAK